MCWENLTCQIFIHFIFAVQSKNALIEDEWESDLHQFIKCEMARNQNQVIAINGLSNHIHILAQINPDCEFSALFVDLKEKSAQWINNHYSLQESFAWQEGYGAVTCSPESLDEITDYINDQKFVHLTKGFVEEYKEFLMENEIEFDERDIFTEPT
ncbi:MAG: IS200/IS605 family transposase [Bacteroidota bacterium]